MPFINCAVQNVIRADGSAGHGGGGVVNLGLAVVVGAESGNAVRVGLGGHHLLPLLSDLLDHIEGEGLVLSLAVERKFVGRLAYGVIFGRSQSISRNLTVRYKTAVNKAFFDCVSLY